MPSWLYYVSISILTAYNCFIRYWPLLKQICSPSTKSGSKTDFLCLIPSVNSHFDFDRQFWILLIFFRTLKISKSNKNGKEESFVWHHQPVPVRAWIRRCHLLLFQFEAQDREPSNRLEWTEEAAFLLRVFWWEEGWLWLHHHQAQKARSDWNEDWSQLQLQGILTCISAIYYLLRY